MVGEIDATTPMEYRHRQALEADRGTIFHRGSPRARPGDARRRAASGGADGGRRGGAGGTGGRRRRALGAPEIGARESLNGELESVREISWSLMSVPTHRAVCRPRCTILGRCLTPT